jgi:hypothetical protein
MRWECTIFLGVNPIGKLRNRKKEFSLKLILEFAYMRELRIPVPVFGKLFFAKQGVRQESILIPVRLSRQVYTGNH